MKRKKIKEENKIRLYESDKYITKDTIRYDVINKRFVKYIIPSKYTNLVRTIFRQLVVAEGITNKTIVVIPKTFYDIVAIYVEDVVV